MHINIDAILVDTTLEPAQKTVMVAVLIYVTSTLFDDPYDSLRLAGLRVLTSFIVRGIWRICAPLAII